MNKKLFFAVVAILLVVGAAFVLTSGLSRKSIELPGPPSEVVAQKTLAVSAEVLPSEETPLFKTLMTKDADASAAIYEVQAGDNLTKIAKQHGVTVGLIKRVNQLASDVIRPGMKLEIPTQKFSVVVDKSQNILILKAGEEVLKTYTVSTGTNNSTPVGVFKATDKLLNPTWYKAGAVVAPDSPENVLGTRWIGIDKPGYGIHGTTEPDKLGQQVTAGCVRMKNEDVEELYDIVPSGTEITIVD